MNDLEGRNFKKEVKDSLPEKEVKFVRTESKESIGDISFQKEKVFDSKIENAKSIENLRSEIRDSCLNEEKKIEIKKENFSEIETIDGIQYKVTYVPKEEIYPAFGYAGGRTATIREDLSPRVKRFVRSHELYHLIDKSKWGGVFGSELRANLIPGMKDPFGLIATIWKTVSDKDRMDFYLKRVKGGF